MTTEFEASSVLCAATRPDVEQGSTDTSSSGTPIHQDVATWMTFFRARACYFYIVLFLPPCSFIRQKKKREKERQTKQQVMQVSGDPSLSCDCASKMVERTLKGSPAYLRGLSFFPRQECRSNFRRPFSPPMKRSFYAAGIHAGNYVSQGVT